MDREYKGTLKPKYEFTRSKTIFSWHLDMYIQLKYEKIHQKQTNNKW